MDATKLKYDYSGLARLDDTSFVVVHDAKGSQRIPRLGVVHMRDGIPIYVSIPWQAPTPPSDLESICPIPGKPGEFLAVESGYRNGQGRVYHLRLHKVNQTWKMTLKKWFQLPRYVEEVEGSACIATKDGRLILILGERGGTKATPTGRLRWGEMDLDATQPQLHWPEAQKLALKAIPGLGVGWRGCSDLHIDEMGNLWAAAALDGGDEGPFHSAIRHVGQVTPDNPDAPISLLDTPETVATLTGIKVEGLADASREGARFTIATDDESFGGTFKTVK